MKKKTKGTLPTGDFNVSPEPKPKSKIWRMPEGREWLDLAIIIGVLFCAWAYNRDMTVVGLELQNCRENSQPAMYVPGIPEYAELVIDLPVPSDANSSEEDPPEPHNH